MRELIRSDRRTERGVVAPIFALFLIALLGMAALVALLCGALPLSAQWQKLRAAESRDASVAIIQSPTPATTSEPPCKRWSFTTSNPSVFPIPEISCEQRRTGSRSGGGPLARNRHVSRDDGGSVL